MSVAARLVEVRKVVKPRVQAEVVEEREDARAGVKEMVGRKVVEIDAAVSIIGIKPILVAHVNRVSFGVRSPPSLFDYASNGF